MSNDLLQSIEDAIEAYVDARIAYQRSKSSDTRKLLSISLERYSDLMLLIRLYGGG